MATLRIALEEGFAGDAVVVEVDGRTVLERDDVRTRMQVGFAERLEVPVDAGEATLEVRVPQRGAAGRLTCSVADRLHVGVSLRDDEVVFRTSEQPFGYV
ncbi:hypothetical protein [Geodermatophilus sp. SYSU D01105]